MPTARPVHRHPVGLRVQRHGAGPAEPDPSGFGHPDLADLTGHAAHIPLPAAPYDPESLIPAGLAPRRPPGRIRRVEECGHRLGEVAQGLLLDRLGAGSQPRVLGSGPGELSALLQVARRVPAARVPVGVLLDGRVPYVPGVAAVVPQHRLLGGSPAPPGRRTGGRAGRLHLRGAYGDAGQFAEQLTSAPCGKPEPAGQRHDQAQGLSRRILPLAARHKPIARHGPASTAARLSTRRGPSVPNAKTRKSRDSIPVPRQA
jgi:hypothetical protein